MENTDGEILVTIIIATTILVVFIAFFVIFAQMFRHRQKIYRQEQAAIQARFAEEILRSQLEVQNDTLQKIGQELHDNIGQLLTVARINLNILEGFSLPPPGETFLREANEVVGQSITELRNLTRSLDGDFVASFGLEDSLRHELQRIAKTNRYKTQLERQGDRKKLGPEKEIVLFRMAQEAINNALKHASATTIQLLMHYAANQFTLQIRDNGQGFRLNAGPETGRGLANLQRRAASIGATLHIHSEIGMGTTVGIELSLL